MSFLLWWLGLGSYFNDDPNSYGIVVNAPLSGGSNNHPAPESLTKHFIGFVFGGVGFIGILTFVNDFGCGGSTHFVNSVGV
jgi:hypothetical protein